MNEILLTEAQKQACEAHLNLLKKWNQIFNLTAITDWEDMWVKHVLDSLSILPYLPKLSGLSWIDVGTGGGFPGVPLAILRPDWSFTLLDSNAKKIRFLNQVKIELGLANIFPLHARVEKYVPSKKFDGVLSRAFASLDQMMRDSEHLLAPGGKFYALKARESEPVSSGFQIESEIPLHIPGLIGSRKLVIAAVKRRKDCEPSS